MDDNRKLENKISLIREDVDYLLSRDMNLMTLETYVEWLQEIGLNHDNADEINNTLLKMIMINKKLKILEKRLTETLLYEDELLALPIQNIDKNNFSDLLSKINMKINSFNYLLMLHNDLDFIDILKINNQYIISLKRDDEDERYIVYIVTDVINQVVINKVRIKNIDIDDKITQKIKYIHQTFLWIVANNVYIIEITINSRTMKISINLRILQEIQINNLKMIHDDIQCILSLNITKITDLQKYVNICYYDMVIRNYRLIIQYDRDIITQNPISSIINISNLQSFDWLSQIYESTIKELTYNIYLDKEVVSSILPAIGYEVKFNFSKFIQGLIKDSDYYIIAGFHDANEFDPNKLQVASYFTKYIKSKLKINVSKLSGIDNVSIIKNDFDKYADIPLVFNRKQILTGANEKIAGKLRIWNEPVDFKMIDFGFGKIDKLNLITFATTACQKKSSEQIDENYYKNIYEGKEYISGFCHTSKRNDGDECFIIFESKMKLKLQILISADDVLSYKDSSADYEVTIDNNEIDKSDQSITMYEYIENGVSKKYLGTEIKQYDTLIPRKQSISIPVDDYIDTVNKIRLTRKIDDKYITPPFETDRDMVLYEIDYNSLWDRKDARDIYLNLIRDENIGLYGFNDDLFNGRNVQNQNLKLEEKIAPNKFSFNGTYRQDGYWSQQGYYSENDCQISIIKRGVGYIDNRNEDVRLNTSINQYDSPLITMTMNNIPEVEMIIPLEFTGMLENKMTNGVNELNINQITLTVAHGTTLNFTTDNELLKLKNELEILINTSLTLYDMILDINKRLNQIHKVINSIIQSLNDIIDHFNNLTSRNENIFGELLQTAIFAVDIIMPSLTIFLTAALLVYDGIKEITENDLSVGIANLFLAAIIGGIYGYSNYDKFINAISIVKSKFRYITNPLSKLTRYFGSKFNNIISTLSRASTDEVEMIPLMNLTITANIEDVVYDESLYVKSKLINKNERLLNDDTKTIKQVTISNNILVNCYTTNNKVVIIKIHILFQFQHEGIKVISIDEYINDDKYKEFVPLTKEDLKKVKTKLMIEQINELAIAALILSKTNAHVDIYDEVYSPMKLMEAKYFEDNGKTYDINNLFKNNILKNKHTLNQFGKINRQYQTCDIEMFKSAFF